MKKLWFKAKHYGWGWYPSSWEGWLVLLVYISFVIWRMIAIEHTAQSEDAAVMAALPVLVVATGILLGICFWKGEKPRWRWGEKD